MSSISYPVDATAHTFPHSITLSAAGVSIVFRVEPNRLPDVLHWGTGFGGSAVRVAEQLAASGDPAVMNSSLDAPRRLSIVPHETEGWSGTPGYRWHRAGIPGVGLSLVSVEQSANEVRFTMVDRRLELELEVRYAIDEGGVVSARATVTNQSTKDPAPVDVLDLALLLPLPRRAAEIVDQTGRWSGERRPQRHGLVDGAHVRSIRRGRPGHDSPLVSLAGTPRFGFRHGEVWASHIAWSGNQEYVVERLPEGAGVATSVMGARELLAPGEIRLGPRERYETPEMLFAWSDEGIDGVSARLHARVRRESAYPSSVRPLVLNTWEAVYFDHDLDRLLELATEAAEIGVERFVLDDGWFHGRRNDHAGLGDWSVDRDVWPRGLGTLADRVHALGMEFGLWFEPEMVNLDSDLARAHPEWVLSPHEESIAWRHQHVLDLADPDAAGHVLEQMSALVSEYAIDFIKWDHNRDLHGAVNDSGRPRVHAQTLAAYALMDELRSRHPGLEIESCASGGARIDLGIMAHAQRVWPSDTNDPIERQDIQRWTGVLLPPELVGSHVGPEESHTTHRVTSLSFRLVTALFGHAGIEWDLTRLGLDERTALTAWARLYRELRPLIHSGTTVRADDVDSGAMLHGIVSADRTHAVFAWVRTETSATGHSSRVVIPGLDPRGEYSVRVRDEVGAASRHEVADPAWMSQPPRSWSGEFLGRIGLPLPVLNPAQAMLIELTAKTKFSG
jgi:alpha-galactosidase